MGINVDNVIDKESIVHIICSICTEVVEDSIILRTCEHIFCRSCITEWEQSQTADDGTSNCPECRTNFVESDFGKPSRILLNLIAEVKFRCLNGCEEIIKYGEFTLHDLRCQKSVILCDECGSSLERSQLEGHKARLFCFYQCKKKNIKLVILFMIFYSEWNHNLILPCI